MLLFEHWQARGKNSLEQFLLSGLDAGGFHSPGRKEQVFRLAHSGWFSGVLPGHQCQSECNHSCAEISTLMQRGKADVQPQVLGGWGGVNRSNFYRTIFTGCLQ